MDRLSCDDMVSMNNFKCSKCGQPLPQIMTCEEWKKAGEDLIK